MEFAGANRFTSDAARGGFPAAISPLGENRDGLYSIFGPASSGAAMETAGRPGMQRLDGEGRRMTAKVTVEDVERVAELAHLKLKPDETGPMRDDLNAILDYVAELNELDTAGVAPLTQVTELLDAAGGGLRGDVVLPSLDRATVLKQAPETDQVFFKVPKVIER